MAILFCFISFKASGPSRPTPPSPQFKYIFQYPSRYLIWFWSIEIGRAPPSPAFSELPKRPHSTNEYLIRPQPIESGRALPPRFSKEIALTISAFDLIFSNWNFRHGCARLYFSNKVRELAEMTWLSLPPKDELGGGRFYNWFWSLIIHLIFEKVSRCIVFRSKIWIGDGIRSDYTSRSKGYASRTKFCDNNFIKNTWFWLPHQCNMTVIARRYEALKFRICANFFRHR